MLIKQPQIRIVSKAITLPNGEAAFAYFALINFEGAIEVRYLGTKAAPAEVAQEGTILSLPQAFRHAPLLALGAVFQAYIAPFVYTLVFLVNQPARAPNLA